MANTWHVYTASSTKEWMYVVQDDKFNHVCINRGDITFEIDQQRVELFSIYYALLECKKVNQQSLFTSTFKIYCAEHNMIENTMKFYDVFFENIHNRQNHSQTLIYALTNLRKKLQNDKGINIEILPQPI